MITIKIKCSNKSILSSTVYRPPDNDNNACQQWLLNMDESLYKINSEKKQIVLTGDITIDLLSDKSHTLKTSWANTTAYMELIQIIKDPTRISRSANALIDHIYVSKDLPIIQSMPIE